MHKSYQRICNYVLDHSFRIHTFSPISSCLIVEIVAIQAKFLEQSGYCTVISVTFTFQNTTNGFGCFHGIMAQFKLVKHKFLI